MHINVNHTGSKLIITGLVTGAQAHAAGPHPVYAIHSIVPKIYDNLHRVFIPTKIMASFDFAHPILGTTYRRLKKKCCSAFEAVSEQFALCYRLVNYQIYVVNM